jgi:hypothetical protein
MNWNQVWSWAIPFLLGAAGGLGGVVLASFTRFGEGLVGHVFDRKMETFRHGLDQQIEALRARLAVLGDRGVRSNELEYRATILVWESFVDAYMATLQCVMQAVRYPDFSRLSEEEARDFLSSTELTTKQQDEVMKVKIDERNKAYTRTVEFREIARAGNAIYDAHAVLRKQGIFIPDALEKAITSALTLCGEARGVRYMEFDHSDFREGSKVKIRFFEEGPQIFDALKADVRARIMANIDVPDVTPKTQS